MTNLITLTEAATAHIKQMLVKQPGSLGFRIAIKKTGCSGYAYVPTIVDKTIETDIQVEANGLMVYVDANSSSLLKDLLIDYVEDSGLGVKQKRLVFINPNEKNRCGCGESFTIE